MSWIRSFFTAVLAITLAAGLVSPAQAAPPLPTLASSPRTQLVGKPVTFSGSTPFGGVIAFGDGAIRAVASGPFAAMHAYATPGLYVARVQALQTGQNATAGVTIEAPTPRVPVGQIYTVTPALAPALAGDDDYITITYSIANPTTPFVTQLGGLEVVVDLLDANGNLIRRSDPFALPVDTASGAGIRTVRIPYLVPVDGEGKYQLRPYIRSSDGGTVATAVAVPFQIIGGPDPAPKFKNTFKGKGAIEIGPHAGHAHGVTFDPGMTTALLWPYAGVDISGLLDPVSHHADPLVDYRVGAPQEPQAPDAAAASVSGISNALGGRAQTSMPDIMGSGTTIRGLDSTTKNDVAIFHVGYGYTQLPSTTGGAQFGSLFDVTRLLPREGSLRLTAFQHSDRESDFVGTSPTSQPMSGQSLALEFKETLLKNVSILATGLASQVRGLSAGDTTSIDDTADGITLGYQRDRTNATIEYDNAGPSLATGGGPTTIADRSTFTSALSVPISPITTFTTGYSRNTARSAFSLQSDAFVGIAIVPPSGLQVSLSARRDTQKAFGADTKSNQVVIGLSRTVGQLAFNLNASVLSLDDLLGGASSGTTRTAQLQVTRQTPNRHTFAIGVNANGTSGPSPSAQVTETATYGFPFATRPNGNGFELMLEGDNANDRSAGFAVRDRSFSSILAYHLGPHASLGLRYELRNHNDALTPLANTKADALRLRFDLQL